MKAFLSYPSEREKEARVVYKFAKDCGLDIFFDKESLVGGQDWDRTLKDAQKNADLTLLIFSPETSDKTGVIQREIKEILRRMEDRPFGDIYLLILRTEPLPLPPELERWQYIDLFKPDWQQRLAKSFELKSIRMDLPVSETLLRYLQTTDARLQIPEVIRHETKKDDFAGDFFTYNLPGRYWQYVNSEIISEMFRDFYQQKHFSGTWDVGLEWTLRMEEFYRNNEIVSLRFFVWSYSHGAAHPNHGVFSKNFGGEEVGKFNITDLISTDEASLKFIKEYCELDIRRQLLGTDSPEPKFDLAHYVDNHDWSVFHQFNFDEIGLTINLSPYDILPYVLGSFEVRIPWDQLQGRINEDFTATEVAQKLILPRG